MSLGCLLVDDEVSIQRAVAPLLRSRGYEVEVAGLGAEAIRRVDRHPPDLIVLDLGLPDLEGTEVCRRVRSLSAVPIIVLSARGSESRQSRDARSRRRRLRYEAVQPRGTAGADSRRAAARVFARRTPTPVASQFGALDHRLRPPPRACAAAKKSG